MASPSPTDQTCRKATWWSTYCATHASMSNSICLSTRSQLFEHLKEPRQTNGKFCESTGTSWVRASLDPFLSVGWEKSAAHNLWFIAIECSNIQRVFMKSSDRRWQILERLTYGECCWSVFRLIVAWSELCCGHFLVGLWSFRSSLARKNFRVYRPKFGEISVLHSDFWGGMIKVLVQEYYGYDGQFTWSDMSGYTAMDSTAGRYLESDAVYFSMIHAHWTLTDSPLANAVAVSAICHLFLELNFWTD